MKPPSRDPHIIESGDWRAVLPLKAVCSAAAESRRSRLLRRSIVGGVHDAVLVEVPSLPRRRDHMRPTIARIPRPSHVGHIGVEGVTEMVDVVPEHHIMHVPTLNLRAIGIKDA